MANTSVTECDETAIFMNNLSTKQRNTIATNVTSVAWINYHSKKVPNCYILHTVSLVILLLLITIILFDNENIICYHYAKRSII